MPEVSITTATAADMNRVRDLAYRIWPATYGPILGEERIGPMLAEIYTLDVLRADMAERGHVYWLAANDSGDLGFVSAYRDGDRVWIKKIYVLDSARGLGLGKALIETAHRYFGRALPVALYVNDGNAGAIGFYRSQGFEIESTVPVRMGPFDFTDHVMVRPGAT